VEVHKHMQSTMSNSEGYQTTNYSENW